MMHLILTHEQADFDALASLYGAYLLDERARPILPRRMNRNVRAFVTLYGAEFPFVEPDDLPRERVTWVTLVDTQSLVTVKGMGKRTRVRVLDHHPRRADLPEEWQVTCEEVGATTTLLVEAWQERNGHLSTVQATLLLLGIYEDTGSLTYASTTPRDVRAAAYLLECGASLKIAANFLNPPLSPAQRRVYDRLVAHARTYDVHGHRVVVTCGDATGMDEEISSLAHKLRDHFDPDALFVLVATDEGVRLVARSTSDEIDVAAVAAHFGGGGHDRAAAALIRPPDEEENREKGALQAFLSEQCRRLVDVLPRFVRPSITVAQIMSHDPQVLSPETPAEEAAKRMQRYGYEGFPVVRDGRVIGLLTRRAVDRALAHKLNLTAASLMEAGEVTVRPQDSLQTLQARMTESGWGQIPVVDPQSGHVIGIVTRTDLLKTLAPPDHRPGYRDLAERLEEALPPSHFALIRAVAEEGERQQMAVYVVGGFVRDLLLERPGLDFDIVVEGDAIALARALARRYGGRVTTHRRFGTAKWFLPRSPFGLRPDDLQTLDLISARTEFYERPSALPTVERGSIKLDLHRRDFTINTLAIRLDGRHFGKLYDYWGGLSDLERGLVRVLHSLSFIDDPTRMLRAVRYEQRYDFRIEERTLQLMDGARPLLARLSGDRVRHELDLILDEPRAPQMLARLAELDLLKAIHPDLPWDESLRALLQKGLDASPPDEFGSLPDLSGVPRRRALGYLLWLSGLAPERLREVGRRLRFVAPLLKALIAAATARAAFPTLAGAPPSAWTARLDEVPPLAVYALWLAATDEAARTALHQYLSRWRFVSPRTDGHVLRARGLPPGPIYRRILSRLRRAWLDGEVHTEEEEQALLEQLLRDLT
ncbi:MAG: CBS domain-containing protein [Anaerolineae bacterium]|nr:MAG: CBS domain-containing protein [Anaerolineae bacterium]